MNDETSGVQSPPQPPSDDVRTIFFWLWRLESAILLYEIGTNFLKYAASYLASREGNYPWLSRVPSNSDFSLAVVRILCLIAVLWLLSLGESKASYSRWDVIWRALVVATGLGIIYALVGLNESAIMASGIWSLVLKIFKK